MCVSVFRKHLPLPVAALGEVWLKGGQVAKGLECQAKESGLCPEGTGETQKDFEQGRAGLDFYLFIYLFIYLFKF